MDVRETLQQLGDLDHPLSKQQLKLLSDLDAAGTTAFAAAWPRISSERRVEVVEALVELAEDNIELDFRQVFLVCLDDAEAAIRTVAVNGLWEDDRISTLRRMLELRSDPAGSVREAVMLFLGRAAYRAEMGELPEQEARTVCTVLLDAASDPEQPVEVRRRAVEGIGYLCESAEAQVKIGRAYAHAEQLMRESALVAMGRSMQRAWFPYIERELRSISPAMRYEAARAVGELGEEGRVLQSALLPLVDDDDTEVSQAAIWSLGQIGGSSARRVLERLARSQDEGRSQVARDALAEAAFDEL